MQSLRPLLTIAHLRDEPVSLSGHCLNKPGPVCILPEGRPYFPDRRVDPVLGIDEDVFAPKTFHYFLPGNNSSIFFDQQDEQLQGNAFELDLAAEAAQFEAGRIHLEIAKLV